MRFRLHCANPETGKEYDWEIEGATIQEAEQFVHGAGLLVSRIEPVKGTTETNTMLDRRDIERLEQSMTRAVFRGAFYAILLGIAIFWALSWVLALRAEQAL